MLQNNHLDSENNDALKPGAFLAVEREKRGVSLINMANKLNLREQVLAHLEADEYQFLPEAVFVQGYIRAYCKYLEIPGSDELILAYQVLQPPVAEAKFDKHVWMKPVLNSNQNEKWLYRMTSIFVFVAMFSVVMWWYQNKADHKILPKHFSVSTVSAEPVNAEDVKVTDISQMRQILNHQLSANINHMSAME